MCGYWFRVLDIGMSHSRNETHIHERPHTRLMAEALGKWCHELTRTGKACKAVAIWTRNALARSVQNAPDPTICTLKNSPRQAWLLDSHSLRFAKTN